MTGDGGVVVKLVKRGQDYKRPNEGATVRVAYTARVGDGAGPIFEQRSREDPLEFVVDEGVNPKSLCLAPCVLGQVVNKNGAGCLALHDEAQHAAGQALTTRSKSLSIFATQIYWNSSEVWHTCV